MEHYAFSYEGNVLGQKFMAPPFSNEYLQSVPSNLHTILNYTNFG
jgi:hypothetical protein